MCGICGAVGFNGAELVEKMNQEMIHRGPDDIGAWFNNGVSLGHTRLSIIDLSSAGHQPMSNEDDTIWITFNGEVYNFQTLSADLKKQGHRFKSKTDAEVIIHLYEEYGQRCLNLLRGMFSFAVWDKNKNIFFAARDHFGIKPFFYYFKGGKFIFSSELKAMLACGLIRKDINIQAVGGYLACGCVQAPGTMIEGVYQLLPAHYIILEDSKLTIKRYWELDSNRQVNLPQKTQREHISDIRSILDEAVKNMMVSDVSLGAFLSGGIDSSVIVALMQRHSSRPVKTFSVVYEEANFDESEFSKDIAKIFNTDHEQILLKEGEILKDMPVIFDSMNQPSIDGFNTFVVSKAVKKAGLTVALSGLGGDELFAGYSSFKTLPAIYGTLNTMKLFPKKFKEGLTHFLKRFIKTRQNLKLLFSVLGCENLEDLYFLKRRVFLPQDIDSILAVKSLQSPEYNRLIQPVKETDIINRLSFLEITNYLQNMLLPDTDCMSMANSLEVRVPYLDHILVEKTFEIPGSLKIGKDYPKRLLIKAMQDLLPRQIYNRPKKGFVFPFEQWLRGGLKGYCSERFSKENIKRSAFLDSDTVNKIWLDFLRGSKLYNYASILAILSLVNWHNRNILE